MKILVWNYRGAAKPSFNNYTKILMHQHNAEVMCFLETRLDESALNHIHKFFGPSCDVMWFLLLVSQGVL